MTTSTHDLTRMIKSVPSSLHEHFLGVFPIDRLPILTPIVRYPLCFIINSDSSNLPGTHWTAVYISASRVGEYFDSFGYQPPTRLQRWLNVNCRFWLFSQHFIQGPLSYTCGLYTVYYLDKRFSGCTLRIILQTLLNSTNADKFVLDYASKL